jgi:hypothetical protein
MLGTESNWMLHKTIKRQQRLNTSIYLHKSSMCTLRNNVCGKVVEMQTWDLIMWNSKYIIRNVNCYYVKVNGLWFWNSVNDRHSRRRDSITSQLFHFVDTMLFISSNAYILRYMILILTIVIPFGPCYVLKWVITFKYLWFTEIFQLTTSVGLILKSWDAWTIFKNCK